MNYLEQELEIRKSSIHGNGIFTKSNIPEGSVICAINGEVIDEAECIRREDEENNVYIFWNGDSYIDTRDTKIIKNLNHYCTPNCDVDEDENNSTILILVADREIEAGEELTIDYDYEEIYEYCNCDLCRARKSA